MIEQLELRLRQLRAEFEKGQQKLQEMEGESANLRSTLLRISGAVQVLEEELEKYRQQNGQEIAPVTTAQSS